MMIRRRPHAMLMMIAIGRANRKIGIRKERAMISFVKKVVAVASQIAFFPFRFEDSSETWMPRASENASAIAIVRIPPMTASLEPVPVFSPTIIARVVIIPEVRPKDMPVFIGSFILYIGDGCLLSLLSEDLKGEAEGG